MIALTATATPKVQDDIIKNLSMSNASVFKSSFNRPNLFYEVKIKQIKLKEILFLLLKKMLVNQELFIVYQEKRLMNLLIFYKLMISKHCLIMQALNQK